MVRALTGRGELDRARKVLGEARAILAEDPKLWPRLAIDAARAQLLASEARWEESFEAFKGVAAEFEKVGTRPGRAGALRNWAEAHLARRESADSTRAIELLGEALAEYEDMGATGWVERVQARLAELEN